MAFVRRPPVVLTSYYRPKPGGLCPRMFRALQALLDRGCEVHYLAVEPFPINHPRCHFHRFPWRRSTESLLFWICFLGLAPFWLGWLCLRHRVAVMLAFDPVYAAAMQPSRLLLRRRLVLLLRADSVENQRIKGTPDWIVGLLGWLEGMAIWRAEVFGVCRSVLDSVLGRHVWLKPSRAGVLANDLPAMSWNPPEARRDILRLACVGTLETRKNQAVVIEALGKIGGEGWRLDFYGDGPARGQLLARVDDLKLGEKVRFYGWVTRDRIWPNVDLLLLPSLHEGMSNAALEALASSIPVMASDVPEHREILPAASLVDPRVVDDWVGRLRMLLSDSGGLSALREAQAESAHRLKFDWDQAVFAHIANGPA